MDKKSVLNAKNVKKIYGLYDEQKVEALKGINSVSITSGASTPSYIVDEIIDYLKKQ